METKDNIFVIQKWLLLFLLARKKIQTIRRNIWKKILFFKTIFQNKICAIFISSINKFFQALGNS